MNRPQKNNNNKKNTLFNQFSFLHYSTPGLSETPNNRKFNTAIDFGCYIRVFLLLGVYNPEALVAVFFFYSDMMNRHGSNMAWMKRLAPVGGLYNKQPGLFLFMGVVMGEGEAGKKNRLL